MDTVEEGEGRSGAGSLNYRKSVADAIERREKDAIDVGAKSPVSNCKLRPQVPFLIRYWIYRYGRGFGVGRGVDSYNTAQ